jgi:hypothetical protein
MSDLGTATTEEQGTEEEQFNIGDLEEGLEESATETGEEEQEEEQVDTLETQVATLSDQVHKLSSGLGRVNKSLFPGQSPQTPQAQQGVQQTTPIHQPQTHMVQTDTIRKLADTYGEEAVGPLVAVIQEGIANGIAPYRNMLDQINQAMSVNDASNQNKIATQAAFNDVKVADVAQEMRNAGVKEEDVQLFESNPYFFDLGTTGAYYRAALANASKSGEKQTVANLVDKAKKNSKPVLKGGSGKAPQNLEKQFEGKTNAQLRKIFRNNPKLRTAYLKQIGAAQG